MASVIDKTSEAYKNDKHLAPATKRVFKAFKKALEQFSKANKGMNAYSDMLGNRGDGGERFALSDGKIDVDPKSVTEEDVRTLLTRAYKKEYKDKTYLPVRVNTPYVMIEAASAVGITIKNSPIVMPVQKIRQAMSNAKEWRAEGNFKTQAHNLSTDEMIEIIRAMDKPKYILLEKESERLIEVVVFDKTNGENAIAVVEFGDNYNPDQLNGYAGGNYQALITTYPFDSNDIEDLINNKNNLLLYPNKKKGSSQRGIGHPVPSHLNESPFAISIPNSTEKVNPSDKISSKISVEDGRASVTANRTYSYNELVAKDPILVIDIADNVPLTANGKIDRALVLKEGRANVESRNNPNNTANEKFIHNYDLDIEIRINRDSFNHGLSRNAGETALATMRLGDLLESAIAVNEINGRTSSNMTTDMGYVLVAFAQNKNGSYLVRFVVDKNTNTVSSITSFVLGATRANKNGALILSPNEQKNTANSKTTRLSRNMSRTPYLSSATISIADLLNLVKGNELANEVFSKDVARKLNVTRTVGSLTDSLRFSLSTPSPITGQTPSFVDSAAKSVTLQSSKYKSTFNERKSDAWTAIKMDFTNAQAGLERLMREVGISQPDAEAMVQYTRLANAQANNLIGGKFIDISGNMDNEVIKEGKGFVKNITKGKGLVESLAPVMPDKFTKEGNTEAEQRYADFQLVGQHLNNIDRMSLEENAKNNISTSLLQKQKNLLQFCEKYNIMML